jgi:hypothetical protein
MSKEKWIYAAAMVDAEGCISIGAANHVTKAGTPYIAYMLRIQVANTSVKLMDWFVENFGGVVYKKKNNLNPKKPVNQWFTKGGWKAQEKFLLGILPYLLIKREQALVALEFIRMLREENPEHRRELWAKCGALNRGESPTTNTSSAEYEKAFRSLIEYKLEPDMPIDDDISVKIESEHISDNVSGPVVTQESQ